MFPPLNASAAEHLWAAMDLLPDCTPLVQLCLDYTSSIWPLSISCRTGTIVCAWTTVAVFSNSKNAL